MYKVFINDSSINLIDRKHSDVENCMEYDTMKSLYSILRELQISDKAQEINLVCDDTEKVWRVLMDFYKLIEAAGGVVKNPQGEILMIFRLGKWDLPKGKLEEGESIQEGAIREVQEECGIGSLEIVKELPVTYHTYIHKGKFILKRTFWFEMLSNGMDVLKPQTEENIEQTIWVKAGDMKEYLQNTYASIAHLFSSTKI